MYNIEDKPSAIKEVQRLLDINQTGEYNNKTSEAVKEIQKSKGLTETGITDYETFSVIVEDYRERVLSDPNGVKSLFTPAFPYSLGDHGSNVDYINTIIRDVFEEYRLETKLPRGNYYTRDTENAVIRLRQIFNMGESKETDVTLFNRIILEREAIQLKKRT